jgi:putative SOS response-associated peptidase YedK
MCGRYSALTEEEIIEIREVIREVSMRIARDEWAAMTPHKAGSEAFPTDNAPVITHGGEGALHLDNLRWGFKKFDGKGVIINARAETAHTKPTFAPHFYKGRCVVPAREYYEWQQQGRRKIKHAVKDAAGNLLFMAGLYRAATPSNEFVIITKPAEGGADEIHDRMPVILRADQLEGWLSGKITQEEIMHAEFNANVVPCENFMQPQLSL